jgi:pyruvate dehydrogenase E2 component (dihydrolipoamide acetyltransferase)
MPIAILMPALSPTMTEGNLVRWHRKVGDQVRAGDLLAEIETDKATMEVEAVDEGILAALLVAEGTEGVKVKTPLAFLLEEEETPEALQQALDALSGGPALSAASAESLTAPASPPAHQASDGSPEVPSPDGTPRGTSTPLGPPVRAPISPLARRVASQNQLPTHTLSGTGPRGRIVHKDVLGALEARASETPSSPVPPSPASQEPLSGFEPAFTEVPLTPMRKVIARRLSESKQQIPHFYLKTDVIIDQLMACRQELNQEAGVKLSINDFVIAACARALRTHPEVNASWAGNSIRIFERVDIAVAVSVEQGLLTPILRDAASKSLNTLSQEMKTLASRAREGKLRPPEFQGGTFSLSNLGMFGVEAFTAIINPPQAAILAVGAGRPQPVVQGDNLAIATVMSLTLSLDHRVVDGATAACFLQTLKGILEKPGRLLL